MKKIFWTTVFWLIVLLGFMFYMRSFDAHMANTVSTWLGATNAVNQDTLATSGQVSITDQITAIQETLVDMQKKLDMLAGYTGSTVSTPSSVQTVTPVEATAE